MSSQINETTASWNVQTKCCASNSFGNLNYPKTTGNESNIILKTYGLPVIGSKRNESYDETFKV